MSHFTVMVIGNNPEKQLAPFNENISVKKYKAEKVTEEEKQLFIKVYTTLDDNEDVSIRRNYGAQTEDDVKANSKLSFDELYEKFGEDWNSNEWEKDEEGVLYRYSTYNPKSKWDWYSLGGRWSGLIKLKKGTKGKKGSPGVFDNEVGIDQARKGDIENFDELKTFAVLKDGVWYERGEMLWFAVVKDEKEEQQWEQELKKLVEGLPDNTLVSIYDCHI